jgi:hypothetical protein
MTGSFNTATGLGALQNNTAGSNITADGINTLLFNKASNNTAIGGNALQRTTTGASNTALGFNALLLNTTGNNNVAIGNRAGINVGAGGGSNDVYIANIGAPASNAIRIGTQNVQKATFIAGIYNVSDHRRSRGGGGE